MNTRTPAELRSALDAIIGELKALDAAAIADADLVPLAKSVQSVGAYVAAVHTQIELRAIANGIMLPGVVVKDAIMHRKWHDPEAAARQAYDQFGKDAFECTLRSPAGIEKLGDAGKAFVSVASFKPEAGKRVVY
jgi:hypothetical protein